MSMWNSVTTVATGYVGPQPPQLITSDTTGTNLAAIHSTSSSTGVNYSRDSGATWTPSTGTPTTGTIYVIVSDSTGQYVLITHAATGFTTNTGGVYRSTDYGASFSQISALGSYAFDYISCSANGQVIYVDQPLSNQLMLSTDGGSTWTVSTTSLGVNFNGCCSANGAYFYQSANASLAVGTGTGTTWSTATIPYSMSQVACDSTGLVLVISCNDSGVYRSTNGGSTWTQTNAPIDAGQTYQPIACDSTGSVIVAGDVVNQVAYFSFDSGSTWTALGAPCRSLFATGNGHTLFGSNGYTLYSASTSIIPSAPTLTSLTSITTSGLTLHFTLGSNGNSLLTDIQYATDQDGYVSWTTVGLSTPLEGYTSATLSGLSFNPIGVNFELKVVNAVGSSSASSPVLAEITPSVPTILNVIDIDTSSVTINYTALGSTGGTPITSIEYANSTDGYASWTSVGTLPSMGGYTYNVEWRAISTTAYPIGNNTWPIHQIASNNLENINTTFIDRVEGYTLPAGTYNYYGDAHHDQNYYNTIMLYDSLGNVVADITDSIGNWQDGGPYSGSFTLAAPTTIYAKTGDAYYMYNTRLTLSFTNTDVFNATVSGLAFNPVGTSFKIRDVNEVGHSSSSSAEAVKALPADPTITNPGAIDSSTVQINFSLGSNHHSLLTDIQYATDQDSYATWTTVGLVGPLEGYTSVTITGLGFNPNGVTFALRAVNSVGPSSSSNALIAGIVPDPCSWTSQPSVVSSSSINVTFSLGYNQGSDLTDIQYARSIDGFTTWTSFGLTPPLEGYSSATLSGLTHPPYGYFQIRSVNLFGASTPSSSTTPLSSYPPVSATQWLTLNKSYFSAVSCTSTGQYITGIDNGTNSFLMSMDYGQTFTPATGLPTVATMNYFAITQDGQTIYVCGTDANVYRSIDYGATFSVVSAAFMDLIYTSMVSNGNGTVIYAVSSNGSNVVVSVDSGVTWNSYGSMSVYWYGLACNNSGTRAYAVGNDTSTGANVMYLSTDSGSTWSLVPQFTFDPNASLNAVCCDYLGQYVMVAAGIDGIYRSSDYGSTWSLINGAYGVSWSSISCDADAAGNIIAGEDTHNCIYNSTNGGATWTVENMDNSPAYTVFVDFSGTYRIATLNGSMTVIQQFPSQVTNPWTLQNGNWFFKVIVASDNQHMAGLNYTVDNQYISTSTDGGSTWTSITSADGGYPNDIATSLNGQIIYYISQNNSNYTYQSTDYGATFTPLMTTPSDANMIVCDTSGEHVIIGTYNGTIYTSIDSGVSFTQAAVNMNTSVNYMACSASGQYVYATDGYSNPCSVYLSNDYGITFYTSSQIYSYITQIVCDQTGMKIFASTYDGVYVSLDYGLSWSITSMTDYIYSMAYDSFGNRIIAMNNNTIYYSVDAGTTWTTLSILGADVNHGYGDYGLSMSPDGTVLIVATANPGTYIKAAGSADTSPVWTAMTGYYFTQVAYSPNNQNVIALSASENLMKYSSDGGATWSYSNDFGPAFYMGTSPSAQYVVVLTNNGEIYRSTDYGHTYSFISNWPNEVYWNGCVVDATGHKIILLGNNGFSTSYVYSSNDSGTTWMDVHESGDYLWSLAASSDFSNLYLTDYNQTIITSVNGGSTWTNISSFSSYSVEQVACDWSGRYVVVATSSDGVYRSTDYGATWNKTNAPSSPPDGPYFRWIATNSTGTHMIASDAGNSVSYLSVDMGITWSIVPTPAGFIGQNPFGISISPDGTRFVTCLGGPGTFFETAGSASLPPVPCFLEGTQILCQVAGVDTYVAIETIRPGMLVKTSLNGYKAVKLIGHRSMDNPGTSTRDKNSLYLCTKAAYPELTADLTLTGCHAILVDHITDVHRAGIISTLERIFVTDRKYRLPACVDERASVVPTAGTFTVWHFALENYDVKMNYGVYAQGLLVETSPLWHMNNKNYTLIQ